jgi:Rrf2 family protein
VARSTNTQFAVAVHVLVILTGVTDGRAVSSGELSKSVDVDSVHVRRVLGPMRNAGLVRSRSGVNGGWELAADPARITLEQVWLVLQGDEPVRGLHGPDPTCLTGRSVQRSLMSIDRTVAHAVATTLGHFSVQDIAQGAPEVRDAVSGPCGLPVWFGRNLDAWSDRAETRGISEVIDSVWRVSSRSDTKQRVPSIR